MRQRRRRARETYPAPASPDSPQPAGLMRRLAALLYDWVLLAGVLFAATAVALIWRGGEAFAPYDPWYTTYLIVTGALFFSGFWVHGGQTLGMRAWRIRLVTVQGEALNWRRALLRCAYALLGGSLFGLGYLWMLLDPQRRCWQDRATDTRVVSIHAKSGT